MTTLTGKSKNIVVCFSPLVIFFSSSLNRRPSYQYIKFYKVDKLYAVYNHEDRQDGLIRRVYRFSDSIRKGPTFRVIHYHRETDHDEVPPEFVDLRISAIIQPYLPRPGGAVVAQNNEAIPAEINLGNVPQVHNDNANDIANLAPPPLPPLPPAPLTILNLIPSSVFRNVHIPDTRMVLVLNQHFSDPFPSVGVRFYNAYHAVFMDGHFTASNNIVCTIPFQGLTLGR
jgi:hypothetical protein